MLDGTRAGHFRLEGGKLAVVVRNDGSNLEDVIENLLKAPPRARVEWSVEIADATVTLADAASRRTWQINSFKLSAARPLDPAQPLEVETSGEISDPQRKGQFHVAVKIAEPPNAEAATQDELKLTAASIPLEPLELLLRRYVAGAKLSGWVSAKAESRWNHQQPSGAVTIVGALQGESLAWSCAALGTDRPSVAQLRASGQAVWQSGRLRVDRVKAESDLGQFTLSGLVDLSQPSWAGRWGTLVQQDCDLTAQMDLAKLAAALPATLHVRAQTQITSGKVDLALAARRNAEGVAWQGNLTTSNLTAQRDGRHSHLATADPGHPDAKETAQGPVVEKLLCKSDFLSAHASGTPEEFNASVNFNLNRLAEQSGGFLDLGKLQLAGDGSARLYWRRTGRQTFEANGMFEAEKFRLGIPGRLAWSEDLMTANASATGQTDFATALVLETAQLKLEGGTTQVDDLEVSPLEPVALGAAAPWMFEVYSGGQFSRWQSRLSPWFDLSQWRVGGSYKLLSVVSLSGASTELRDTELTVTDLGLSGPGLKLREPQARLALSGRWDTAARRLDLAVAELVGTTVSARADRFVLALPTQGPVELTGSAQGEIGLERIQEWTTPGPADPNAWRLQGRLSCKTDFQQSGGVIAGQFDSVISNLVATHPSGQRFQDPEIRFSGRASYNDLNRWLQIERATLTSGPIKSTASGRIARNAGQTDVQVNGRVDYNLEEVSRLLAARFGQGIWIRGNGSAPVSFRGPLGSGKAVATGSLNWEQANLYGFQIGPGEVRAAFSQGVVDVQPLDLEVNEGRLRLRPQLRIAPEPMLLTFDAGRAVEQVRITPAMCSSLLQYIAPLVAGVAQAEGRFSIEIDGANIPLANPAYSEIAGRLVIHSIQISPGLLLHELSQVLGLIGRDLTARLSRESVIPFRMTQGRVWHEKMELVFADLAVRTRGSVGLDQSLSLVLEVPIPSNWAGSGAASPALRGQTIQVPVAGTLRQPRIDRNALAQYGRQFLQNATRNVLEDQLQRQFQQLLNPPQPKR